MATKSILKTIYIKNRKSAAALIQALENADGKQQKEPVMKRSYQTASREEIRSMFGDSHDRIQDR